MKIWLGSLLFMAWLLVLLESVSSQWINLNNTPLAQMTTSAVWYLLCYVLLLLAWQLWRLGQSRKRYQSHQATGQYGVVGLINVIGVFVAFIGISLHGLLQYQHRTGNQLTQAVQVLAHIRIDGLSDGVADTRYQNRYAQTATVINAMPLSLAVSTPNEQPSTDNNNAPSVSVIGNPYAINQLGQDNGVTTGADAYLNAVIDDLLGLKVLIVASKQGLMADERMQAVMVSQNQTGISQTSPNNQPNQQPNQNQVDLDMLTDGQELIVPLSLQPLPDNQPNQAGFNGYRWLTSRGIDAQAKWLSLTNQDWQKQAQTMLNTHKASLAVSEQNNSRNFWQKMLGKLTLMRWQFRQHFMQFDADTPMQQQSQAVALSLLTGDRALINQSTKDLYQLSGISHLLAISGTHVLFLAVVFAGVMMTGIERFAIGAYGYLPRWQWRWLMMVSMSAVYAVFTGFDVPAARTLWMLMAVGVARWLLLPMGGLQVVMAVAALMVWFNPLVLWQAGFWLSFVAVMLLIGYEQAFTANTQAKASLTQSKAYQQIKHFLYLQLWMFVTLLPLSLWLFGKVSMWGVLVNMIAIGLYGWVIVPSNLLAGILYLLSPTLANGVWTAVIALLTSLHGGLAWLTGANITDGMGEMSSAWIYNDISFGVLLLVGVGLWLVVFFKGMHGLRAWAWLPCGAIVMLSWYPNIFLSPAKLSATAPPKPSATTQTHITQTDGNVNPQLGNPATLTLLALGENINRQGVRVFLLHIPKNAQSQQPQHWLILSQVNHQDIALAKLSKQDNVIDLLQNRKSDNHTNSHDELMSRLKNKLASKHLTRLTGIIVQNPDKRLAMTAARLSDDMQAQHWWQAGNDAFLRQLTYHKPTATAPTACQAQSSNAQTNQNDHDNVHTDNQQTVIKKVSGFASIADPSVWTCSLLLQFEAGIQVQSEYMTQAVNMADMQTNQSEQAKEFVQTPLQISPNQSLSYQQVFLDGGAGQRQWRLWQMWCANQPDITSHISHTAHFSMLWLLSHHSPLPDLVADDDFADILQNRMGRPDTLWLSDLSDKNTSQTQQQWLWQISTMPLKKNDD